MPIDRSHVRTALSLLLSFLASVFLTGLAALLIFQLTLLSAPYTKSQLERASYAEYLIADLEESLVSYGSVSGFDEEFFRSVIKISRVQEDLIKEVDKLYGIRSDGADAAAFETYLYDRLQQNAAERGLNANGEADEPLQNLAELCAQAYGDALGLPMIGTASAFVQKLRLPLLLATVALGVFLLVTILFLWRIQPWRRRKLRYLAYTTGASALMLGVPSLLLLVSGKIPRIAITGQALYHLTVQYANGLLTIFLCTAGAFLLLNILLLIWRSRIIKQDAP